MKYLLFFLFVIQTCFCFAQTGVNYKWWNPADASFPVVEGRGWQNGFENFYDRLPAKAEKTVRPELWHLAQNTAGEYIRFTTDATEIRVRYTVSGARSMEHMPATGVSGVDLYMLDSMDTWHWARGAYSFRDTIVYKFSNLVTDVAIKEYRLYLPLYNTVKWMQIGVPEKNEFTSIEVSKEAPLVLYGTSILQGACASRPGLAWTNILGRKLNMPVVNLGFSGNGRLEEPVIELMNENNAKLFVLDCQPNLHDRKIYTEQEIRQRIIHSVKTLRSQHPQTPVLLTEHCGGIPGVSMDSAVANSYKWTSEIIASAFAEMKKQGVKHIYLLTAKQIGFTAESTVDGTHPTDIGMMQYADAYKKIILKILHKK